LSNLNKMSMPITGRHLHNKKPVTMRVQAHSFTINRNNRAKIKAIGEIVFIQMICHFIPLSCEGMAPRRKTPLSQLLI
jgi:hypothetical protein